MTIETEFEFLLKRLIDFSTTPSGYEYLSRIAIERRDF